MDAQDPGFHADPGDAGRDLRHLRDLRYLRWLGATVAASLLGVVLLNAWIDPFAMFDGPSVAGFNAQKTEAHMMSVRTEKSVRLAVDRFDAIVLGSSRAAMGIDPGDPSFDGRRVYNASLFATNLLELERVYDYVAARQDLDLLVMGLDLLLFTGVRDPGVEFERSAFSGRPVAAVVAGRLASWDTLRLSFDTVRENRAGGRAAYRADGSLDWPPGAPEGWNAREHFDESLRQFATNPETYACFRYAPDRADALDRLLETAAARGTEVRLFVSPIHAEQQQLIHEMGLWEAYEGWKRDLAGRVARHRARTPGARVSLWDFGVFDARTTEPVPDDGSPMRWYWESSHYRKTLGGRVLARLAGAAPDAGDGGVRLEPDGLEAHLEAQRRARATWAEANRREAMRVRALARRGEDGRARACAEWEAARAGAAAPDARPPVF